MDSSENGMNSENSPVRHDPALESLIARLVEGKKEHRMFLARLPFEEKVRIVIELQKIAYQIRTSVGKPAPRPWDLSG